ncbi:hypothetical protein ACRWYJ_23370, partial [Escherichia coli]
DVFAGKKSAQIREILISESAWEEMTCLFAPSLINPTISLMMLIVESSSSIFALLLDKAIGLSKACCNRTAKNKCFKSTY